MPGADAPAAARVVWVTRALVTTVTPETPGIPRAMVLTVSFVLPGDRALLPPSSGDHSANLTPASGRQDHTTSPSAKASFVKGASASTASRAATVTIACRPSVGGTGRTCRDDLPDGESGIFLQKGLDRPIT
jgi:hypothetical protein